MRIGELAAQTGTETVTIRFYEKKGLMPAPERSEANYRRYGPQHIEQLLFIRHCRAMDISLEEIAVLLACREEPGSSCQVVNRLIDRHIQEVGKKIAGLQQLEEQLKGLRQRCSDTRNPEGRVAACGILHSLDRCEGGEHCRGHVADEQHAGNTREKPDR